MKSALTILLAPLVAAHYTFPTLLSPAGSTSEWSHVRQWTGYYTNSPVTNVASLDIRCNVGASSVSAPSTLSVAAGSSIGFGASPNIYHPGPVQFYLAKVPAGKTAANWDGAGNVWFKIYEDGPGVGSGGLTWPTNGATTVRATLPRSLPSGEYLFRVEHIGLHSASAAGGAQFYISCGQINVTGGGSGSPSPLVAFPGAYSATDPGLMINIYYPVPTSYTPPGPRPWKG